MHIGQVLQLDAGVSPIQIAGTVTYVTNQSESPPGTAKAWTRQFIVLQEGNDKIGVTLWNCRYVKKGERISVKGKTERNQKDEPAMSAQELVDDGTQGQGFAQGKSGTTTDQGERDATGVSIESQSAYKNTCKLASHRTDLIPDKAAFWDWLHHAKKWFDTGEVDPTVMSSPMPTGPADWDREQTPSDPNQDDSDLPEQLRGGYKG